MKYGECLRFFWWLEIEVYRLEVSIFKRVFQAIVSQTTDAERVFIITHARRALYPYNIFVDVNYISPFQRVGEATQKFNKLKY